MRLANCLSAVTILESERLLFRDHKAIDLDAFCDMQADPEVRRYVGGSPLPREVAKRRFRERFLVRKLDRLALWATIYKPEGRYIGQCGVYPNFEASDSGSTDQRSDPPCAGPGVPHILGLHASSRLQLVSILVLV